MKKAGRDSKAIALNALTYISAEANTYDLDFDDCPLERKNSSHNSSMDVRPDNRDLRNLITEDSNESQMRLRSPTGHDHTFGLLPDTQLPQLDREFLKSFYDLFQSKAFWGSEAQGLPTAVLENAYLVQEEAFLNNCDYAHVFNIPLRSNAIGTHVNWKTKILGKKNLRESCKAFLRHTVIMTLKSIFLSSTLWCVHCLEFYFCYVSTHLWAGT